jgi:hypothetical protein
VRSRIGNSLGEPGPAVRRQSHPAAASILGTGGYRANPGLSNGFRAAVNGVRSIARKDATAAIAGGWGGFNDIGSENYPLVRPTDRSASSKRRAGALAARCPCRQRQQSEAKDVASDQKDAMSYARMSLGGNRPDGK